MNLEEFFKYKNKIMQKFCSDKDIVYTITDNKQSSVPNRTLPYTQIFPYEYVPETIDESKTFVCFDVDITEVINKTYYVPVIYIWIFTHKSKLRLPEGGIRMDVLASQINKILNGNRDIGLGKLDLQQVSRFSPIVDYQGRVLVYRAVDFNRPLNQEPPGIRN